MYKDNSYYLFKMKENVDFILSHMDGIYSFHFNALSASSFS